MPMESNSIRLRRSSRWLYSARWWSGTVSYWMKKYLHSFAQPAERIKMELSSALEPKDPQEKMNVRGRDVQTGSPGAVDVTAAEVHAITQLIIRRIAEEVRVTLTELPAEVAGDIYDRGIILTGGGALLDGLDQYLQKEVGLSVRIADEPRYAIVRGLSQMFDEPLLLRRVARTEPVPLIDTETTVFES